MTSRSDIVYKLVRADEVDEVYAIEIEGFPADEAASLSSLVQRLTLAPELFLGAYHNTPTLQGDQISKGELIGYVCSTLTPSSTLTHDSMSTHVPASPYVAIHSVCIATPYRKQGIALQLLRHYLIHLKSLADMGITGARLITHEKLIPLYEKAGFALVGESVVVHGSLKWFEMAIDFPVVVVRSPGVPLSSIGGIEGVIDHDGMNLQDLYCPRAECKCLLLKKGVGKFVVDGKLDDFKLPPLPYRIASGKIEASTARVRGYWSVNSPLSFENIGFSRNTLPPSSSLLSSPVAATPIAPNQPNQQTIKYLTCADCDQGPLGWHDTEGRDLGLEVEVENERNTGVDTGEDKVQVRKGREFLIDVQRVRYRI